jgi:hypothetical protein
LVEVEVALIRVEAVRVSVDLPLLVVPVVEALGFVTLSTSEPRKRLAREIREETVQPQIFTSVEVEEVRQAQAPTVQATFPLVLQVLVEMA